MDKINNILSYWYNLEFFSPFWPEKTQHTVFINSANKRIPWIEKSEAEYTYDIYLGKIKSQDLIMAMLGSIGEKDDTIEKDSSLSCICAFKLASDGVYIEESFSISAFVWAMAKIIAEKNLRTDLSTVEIDKLNSEMNDILMSFGKKLEYKDLEKIYNIVLEKILLHLEDNAFFAVINRKPNRKKNEMSKDDSKQRLQEDEKNDNNTDMLSSFYTSDIDMIRRKIHKEDKIVKYIDALNNPSTYRVEIDTDVSQMKKWLAPEKYPFGKWPSKYSPSLMQQIAINIGISNNEYSGGIFSVNGPPGTGKTTLLKEIIASNIVERALLLSEYQRPDDAFLQRNFDSHENDHLKYYYQPDSKLVKFGIIVASNNNAAVESISKELPIAEAVENSNTRLFDIEKNKEIYFTDMAKTLMGSDEECWGLISARLGKKSNIDELKQALWFNKKSVNLQQLYKEEQPDWEQAKEDFINKYNEVLNYRNLIQEAVENTNKHDQIVQEYNDAKNEISTAKRKITEQENLINRKIEEQQNIKHQIEMLTENGNILQTFLLEKGIFLLIEKGFACIEI
ncbi:hypothetical protein [Lutispora thermophila]|uniref:AAA domain-containing protein n=1 Tax=Lutispora thermophila DSM 19022 TaxID=1122184 RepID=A0A1M6IJI3_9FIRM|nr:hypothetical protein [Lutispora thermophila]SHJ34549.1 AAA domain-containing protein [Lutispora thermophila DSM 19022]